MRVMEIGKRKLALTHEEDYSTEYGEAIQEEEAKSLLMRYATDIYEKMFGELPEA